MEAAPNSPGENDRFLHTAQEIGNALSANLVHDTLQNDLERWLDELQSHVTVLLCEHIDDLQHAVIIAPTAFLLFGDTVIERQCDRIVPCMWKLSLT